MLVMLRRLLGAFFVCKTRAKWLGYSISLLNKQIRAGDLSTIASATVGKHNNKTALPGTTTHQAADCTARLSPLQSQ